MSRDLKTGVTWAILFFPETMSFMRNKSKIHFNRTNKELKFCFTKLKFIFSKPGLTLRSQEENAVFTSSSDKGNYSKELSDTLRNISNDLCYWGISGDDPVLTKYPLNLLAMVFWWNIFLLLRMRCFGSELMTNYQTLPS